MICYFSLYLVSFFASLSYLFLLVFTLLTNPTYTSTCKGRRYDYFTITDYTMASFALALGGKYNIARSPKITQIVFNNPNLFTCYYGIVSKITPCSKARGRQFLAISPAKVPGYFFNLHRSSTSSRMSLPPLVASLAAPLPSAFTRMKVPAAAK